MLYTQNQKLWMKRVIGLIIFLALFGEVNSLLIYSFNHAQFTGQATISVILDLIIVILSFVGVD
jgi:hypothetical protein